ncbi:MAG: hypothetical protein AAGC56_03170 [Pseudomonadota bacterium]
MKFSIGDVVGRTFSSIGRNARLFAGLSAVLVGVPAFAVGLLQGGADGSTQVSAGVLIVGLIGALVSVVTQYILIGAIVRGAIIDFNGAKAEFGDCFRTGLKHAAPIFAIALLTSLGTVLGLILLVVPGIILAIMWSVSVPVRVVESLGVTESLGRSQELTKGSRWSLFGLGLIYVVILILISGAVGVLGVLTTGLGLIAFALFNAVLTIVLAVIGAVVVAAVYYELRTKKEGVGVEALAAVFD